MESLPHHIQTCKQDPCLCILSVMQQRWNITIRSSSGCWHLRPYWRMAPLRTKGSAVAEETWQEHRHGSDGAHFSGVISDLYVSRQKHFHGWLQALIVHWFIRSQSASSLIIYFPLENALPSLACLIKMWWQTKPGSLSLSDSELKNNFEGLVMVCNQWLQQGWTLRGLRWDKSITPIWRFHWCWCWLTDRQSSDTHCTAWPPAAYV